VVPPEKLRSSTDGRPATCRRCAHPLLGDNPEPLIHQVADLARIEPIVDEFRLHRPSCPDCGSTSCATLPEGVPAGHSRPYTHAVLATLAGAYRLSKRQIEQLTADLFGLTISTGMISKLEEQSAAALAEPDHELARSVLEAEAVNIDETGWREGRRKAWLWVTVTALATVLTIARQRSAAVARRPLGDKEDQVVSSDRSKSYDWLWAYCRQVCWSHLRRGFQVKIDRGGPGERIGRRLLGLSGRLFEAWHQARDGAPGECAFQERILRSRPRVRRTLQDGTKCGCATTARTCAEILRVEEGLWNFVWFPGVEPTNNAAELALRHAVIWRRISGVRPASRGAGSSSGC
jgi:transposase